MKKIQFQRWAAKWMSLAGRYSGGLAWARSLLLKGAVLGMGAMFVFWTGWPQQSMTSDSMSSSPRANVLSLKSIQLDSAIHTPETARDDSLLGKGLARSLKAVSDKKSGQSEEVAAFLVDLNDGTSADLEHLPGIGAILAGRIVAHRTSHGAFRRVEDLVLVPGIGEKRFQQLRSLVGVRGPLNGIEN